MTINSDVFIRRNKLRRIFETEFRKINASIKDAAKSLGLPGFHIKYSRHLLDRAIQREIDENYVFELFRKVKNHVKEVAEFLSMPARPDVDEDFVEGVEYRPGRLGLTVCRENPAFKMKTLQCRMAIINNKRLPGKASKAVIKI